MRTPGIELFGLNELTHYTTASKKLKGLYWFYIVRLHYSDVIVSAMAPQITGVSIVCSTICSGADQGKHQSSASLALMKGIHRWPLFFPHKGPVTLKMFPSCIGLGSIPLLLWEGKPASNKKTIGLSTNRSFFCLVDNNMHGGLHLVNQRLTRCNHGNPICILHMIHLTLYSSSSQNGVCWCPGAY